MQQNIDETLAKTIDEDCPEILSILAGPHGDWHLADAKELTVQLTIVLRNAYKLGRLHEQIRCAEVLDHLCLFDASDIIRDLSISDDDED